MSSSNFGSVGAVVGVALGNVVGKEVGVVGDVV